MPKKTKDASDSIENKDTTKKKTTKKTADNKDTSTKKVAASKTTAKKTTTTKKTEKATSTKAPEKKKAATSKNTTKKTAAKTTTKKSTTATKTAAKKTTTTKKATATEKKTTTTKKTTTKKKVNKKRVVSGAITLFARFRKVSIAIPNFEYYDLPYRYNETTVRLLAQTPTTLFVYWDISEEDREKYLKQFGNDFFFNTIPVLLVYNETKNYYFQVPINDFANSWYLHIPHANCKYHIELGRKSNNANYKLPNDYLKITTSNKIDAPNGRVLIDRLPRTIRFKNYKNKSITEKNISDLKINQFLGGFYEWREEFVSDKLINMPSSHTVNFS